LAVVELDEQIAEKQAEKERLEVETASSLWLADLTEFQEAWIKYSEVCVVESVSVAKSDSAKVARKKQVVNKK
jgi:hypothetical protein